MTWYNKFYRCPSGHEWQDEWNCLCDDRCPVCNTSCEPYDYEEIFQTPKEKLMTDAMIYGTGAMKITSTGIESIPFVMLIRKDRPNESD
jgi:hypothetical protein